MTKPLTEAAQAKQPQSKLKKVLWWIAFVLLLLLLLVSATMFFFTFREKQSHEAEIEELAQIVQPTEDKAEAAEPQTYPAEPADYLPQYRELSQINSDLVGWIRVPNTPINHPVAQGEDNGFYLHRDFKTKKYKRYSRGTIFMDYRNHVEALDTNTILYGHNNLDGTMFSELEQYKKLSFYKQTPLVYFDTVYATYTWKVFAVFYAVAEPELDNGYVFNYIYPTLENENFEAFLKEVRKRSLLAIPVEVDSTDKILTLSTCTRDLDLRRGEQKNARLVVMARLVRDGESQIVDVARATVQAQPKHPQLWYDKHKQENPYIQDEKWYPKKYLKGETT